MVGDKNHVSGDWKNTYRTYRCSSVVGRFASVCHVPSKSVRNRSTSLVYHDCEATVEVELEEFQPEYRSEFGIIPLKGIGMLISLT